MEKVIDIYVELGQLCEEGHRYMWNPAGYVREVIDICGMVIYMWNPASYGDSQLLDINLSGVFQRRGQKNKTGETARGTWMSVRTVVCR